MPIRARERIAGLLLALCLNMAFIAMFIWQAGPRLPDLPEPTRMALVWARPVAETAPPPPTVRRPAALPLSRTARRPPAAIAAGEIPAPEPATELIVESNSADPFEQSGSVVATSFDKAVMGKAIKVAMAERQALEDTQKFVKSARGLTKHEQFAADVEDATIPYCLGKDSMKHTPPVLTVGKVKIGLGGVLVLPFLAKAVATGKCRVK